MKIIGKLAIVVLLAALMLMPLQSVYAKGLLDGGPIFGGSFTLKSGETLNEDLLVFGGSVSIEKDAVLNGSVVVMGGSVTIDGKVSEDVVVMGGSVTINGNVSENVVTLGGAVKLGENAHLYGDLVTMGASVNRESGAKVDGEVVNTASARPTIAMPNMPIMPIFPRAWNGFDLAAGVASLFAQSLFIAFLAMAIAALLPEHMRRVADGVTAKPFIAFGMGLLTLMLFIAVVTVLALLILPTLFLTIPLIVAVAVVFAAGLVFGWLALGLEIGVRLTRMFNREWSLPVSAAAGTFFLSFIVNGISFMSLGGGSMSVLSFMGMLTSAMVGGLLVFAGLGAVFITRFGSRSVLLTAAPAAIASAPVSENI